MFYLSNIIRKPVSDIYLQMHIGAGYTRPEEFRKNFGF